MEWLGGAPIAIPCAAVQVSVAVMLRGDDARSAASVVPSIVVAYVLCVDLLAVTADLMCRPLTLPSPHTLPLAHPIHVIISRLRAGLPSFASHLCILPPGPVPSSLLPGVAAVHWNLGGSRDIGTAATPLVPFVVPLVNGVLGEVDVGAEPDAKKRSATPTSPCCILQPGWAVDVVAKRRATVTSATPTAPPPARLDFLAARLMFPGCPLALVAPSSSLILLVNIVWDEALARARRTQVGDDALVDEQAGSLPHPEQGQATGASGGGPAVPARSIDGEAAIGDVPVPRWSPRTLINWVQTSRGPTSCTPRRGTVGRNIVRGANVVTHNGSERPTGGEHGNAEGDGEVAEGAAKLERPRRLTTKNR